LPQVAKDRAVEGIVLTGSKFALSVLGQGKNSAETKQLLKPFKPGESRLEGLQTKETESGQHILSDAVKHATTLNRAHTLLIDHGIDSLEGFYKLFAVVTDCLVGVFGEEPY
jgi:hypothetical protein